MSGKVRDTTRRRVVVTGIGWVTPLGTTIEGVWQRLCAGNSGIGRIKHFDARSFPTQVAAQVDDTLIEDACRELDRVGKPGRNTRFAVAAAQDAWDDSALRADDVEPFRVGVYMGSGEGALDFFNFVTLIGENWQGDRVDSAAFLEDGAKCLDAIRELEQEPNMPAGHLAYLFGARGANCNCLTACAASSQAIGEATELIRRGDVDVMITGGCHSMIHPFGLAGFNLLTALSTQNDEPTKSSRPFDMKRDGFVLGEGSGMVILEELEHALKRSVHIYGEVAGYGSTGDAFRITDTHPQGRGAIAAMTLALDDAGVAPGDIDYISAHGTSTIVNDKIETKALKEVLGDRAYRTPASSIKSMLGHLIAAAGAVELIVSLLAIRDGIVPPTINYEHPDPECDLDYVPNESRKLPVAAVLSNSFGFGGQNISLVIREFCG